MNREIVEPWERIGKSSIVNDFGETEIIKGETAQAYGAFCVYREMPHRPEDPKKRSLKLVAEELKKTNSVIGDWSAKWRWVERAAQYDAHFEKIRREELELEFRISQRRHLEMARELQENGTIALLAIKPEDYSPTQAIQAMVEGFKMERLIMGDSTENTDNTSSHTVQFVAVNKRERKFTAEEQAAIDELNIELDQEN